MRPRFPKSTVCWAPGERRSWPRREAPVPDSWRKSAAAITALADVPDHSIRVLLIDESAAASYIPWHQIEPKLSRENPLVVTFAATRGGYARHAQYALPVAVYPELTDDIAPAVDSTPSGFPDFRSAGDAARRPGESGGFRRRARWSTSLQLHSANAPTRSTRPACGSVLTYADSKETPVKELTADAFWKALNEGGEWKGERRDAAHQPQAAPTARARGGCRVGERSAPDRRSTKRTIPRSSPR